MLFKVGELARRSGVTVRTLHHYDSIGLLTPSARSDSGYRLYQRADIARLHQIQALRRFGLSLTAIGTYLATPDTPLSAIVAQQIAALERQIAQTTLLRAQLTALQQQLDSGEQPELAAWLSTLEMMTMYDNYFSKEELNRLPLLQDAGRKAQWRALVGQVQTLMAQGVAPASDAAGGLARQWMAMLEHDTDGNVDFVMRINAMMAQETAAREQTGITDAMQDYVQQAFSELKLAIYANYLDPDELSQMRTGSAERREAWLPLIAAVRAQMRAGAAPSDPAVQALARQWFALFRSMAGDRPETQQKIRAAHEKEPLLLSGTWMDQAMLAFLRQSMASLSAA